MIEAAGIEKSYGGKRVLRGVDLVVPPGRVVGLVGHNGAGKTTLLHILVGLAAPDAGSVRIGATDAAGPRAAAPCGIGFVPERTPIYPDLTPLEYVEHFARMAGAARADARARAWSALAEVGLLAHAAKPLGRCSKGLAQRASLARALALSPALLVLDEPESGLDPVARMDLRQVLARAAARGTTILLSSHDLAEVQASCDEVALLREGLVVHRATLPRGAGAARRVRVRVGGVVADAAFVLEPIPEVSDVALEEECLHVRLRPGACPSILATALVRAGIPLLEMTQGADDLQTVYRKLSGGAGA